MQQIIQNFVIKSASDLDITIAGYASVYNIPDQQEDIIVKGAFGQTDVTQIKFLWQHDQSKPIGIIKYLAEDDNGLKVEAIINGRTEAGKEAIELVRQGAVNGLSIGMNVNSASYNSTGQRVITKARLIEISIVTFPANQHAIIDSIITPSNSTNQAKEKNMINDLTIKDSQTIKASQAVGNLPSEGRINTLEERLNYLHSLIGRPEGGTIAEMEYKNIFSNYIRKGSNKEVLITKGLSSADEEGGVLVVPQLYEKIIGQMNAMSPMRQLASIENISTNALDVVIEDGKFACDWVAEAAARIDTATPKLKQKRIFVHELFAQPKATQSLIDDSAIQIEDWLLEKLRDSFVRAENNTFINGDGDKKPIGILNIEKNKIEPLDIGEDITPETLLSLITALPEEYLGNATFLMNRTTLAAIQNLKDKSGRFIWQPTITDSLKQTIFGIPVICSSDFPKPEKESLAIAIGDFRACYKIVDRPGMTVTRDPYTEKPFVKFYTVKRVGGDVINPDAIRIGRLA